MRRQVAALAMTLCLGVSGLHAQDISPASESHVAFQKKGTHYEVIVDLSDGVSHFNAGKEYWTAAKEAVPRLEPLIDSYLDEGVELLAEYVGWSREQIFQEMMRRVSQIKPRLPGHIRSEIEGLTSACAANPNLLGDGRLSRHELYFWNLLADVFRPTACTAFAAFQSSSTTGKSLAARNLDWYDGAQGQLNQLHCVMTLKNGTRSVCLIGYVGFLGAVTAISDDGILAAILDSDTGAAYSAQNRRSYTHDLRYALESFSTQADIARFMADPTRKYAFNHLVFLVDSTDARVLENNISGTGENMRRAVRTWDSTLNPGIKWGIRDAIGVVNSFLLKGNHDNHTAAPGNTSRWETLLREVGARGAGIDRKAIREPITYRASTAPGDPSPGDLFGSFTLQSMIFEPDGLALWVAFKPASGGWKNLPKFEKIKIPF